MAVLCFLAIALPLVFLQVCNDPFVVPKFALVLCTAPALVYGLVCEGLRKRLVVPKGRSLLGAALGLEVLACLIGTVHSVHPSISLWGGYSRHMGSFAALCAVLSAWAAVQFLDRPCRLRAFCLWVLGAGLLSSLLGMAFYRLKLTERVDVPIGNPNYLTNYLLFPALSAMALFLASSDRAQKALSAVTFFSCVAAIALSGTRGAQLGLLAGIVAFSVLATALRFKKPGPLPLAAFAGLSLLAGAIVAYGFLSRAGMGSSGRTLLWRDTLPLLKRAWLLGVGVDGFEFAFLPYRSLDLAKFFPNAFWENAHNAMLQAWITTGILGLAAYLLLAAAGLWGWLNAAKHCKGNDSLLASGFFAALLACLIHNLFNCDTLVSLFYLHIFAGAGWAMSHQAPDREGMPASRNALLLVRVLSCLGLCAFGLLAARLVMADMAMHRCWNALKSKDPESSASHGLKAVHLSPWKGRYHFLLASAMDAIGSANVQSHPEITQRYAALGLDHGLKAREIENTEPSYAAVRVSHLLFNLKRIGEAEKVILEALQMDPHNWASLRLMAVICLQSARPKEALSWAERGLDIYPGAKDMQNTYRDVWYGLVPPQANLAYRQACALVLQGKPQDAIPLYRLALERSQDAYPDAWQGLGYAWELEQNPQEAANAYRKALELSRGLHHEAHAALGLILVNAGQPEEGIQHLKEACRLRPDWELPRRHLAVVYGKLGRSKESKAYVRQCLSLLDGEERERVQEALEIELGSLR